MTNAFLLELADIHVSENSRSRASMSLMSVVDLFGVSRRAISLMSVVARRTGRGRGEADGAKTRTGAGRRAPPAHRDI